MLTARAHLLSPFVHAIDDAGSLCGARPLREWRPSRILPVNCPRCLVRLGFPRYAYCELPASVHGGPLHIRQVGPEGMSKRGVVGGTRALCGRVTGWDVAMVEVTPRPGTSGVCPSCTRIICEKRGILAA